ncbi:uracil-DNA glycosylase family protein [Candidatus Hydrogenedentota bacterium]
MEAESDGRLAEILAMTKTYVAKVRKETGSKQTVSREVADRLEALASRATAEAKTVHSATEGPGSLDTVKDLTELREIVAGCTLCKLHETRTQTVFGSGSSSAKLVFVGEAPGAKEDEQGKPFVGAAGKLLTKIIEAIDLKREDVYICNVLKCRPPGNRDPLIHEKELCEPYLIRQLELIKPKVICSLGNHATQTLLRTKDGIMGLRGKFHEYQGIPLMPTLHPAACLYTPSNKRYVWEDMKMVRDKYNES